MRLIDADEIKKSSQGIVWEEWLDMRPTIDAVPVVRCKDCSYWKAAKLNTKGFLVCPASGMEITEDDYCSYGERKEGNT